MVAVAVKGFGRRALVGVALMVLGLTGCAADYGEYDDHVYRDSDTTYDRPYYRYDRPSYRRYDDWPGRDHDIFRDRYWGYNRGYGDGYRDGRWRDDRDERRWRERHRDNDREDHARRPPKDRDDGYHGDKPRRPPPADRPVRGPDPDKVKQVQRAIGKTPPADQPPRRRAPACPPAMAALGKCG